MDYQILVLDLDGTLTNSKKEITQPTLEALIEIQEAGKKVVLASGTGRYAAGRTASSGRLRKLYPFF
jgi:hydroxymethylpyrimidine pyrophosphatase-like HAD family hydrolase